jgi:Asp-tRNA(Asn)/Glu-tRNA(Gln) amidotransferase A subunit family amidase
MRIGYARNWFAKDTQAAPAVVAAMDTAVSQLSLLGAIITAVELPPYEHFEAAAAAILHAEAFELHAKALAEQPQSYGRMTFQTLAAGVSLTDAEVAEAHRAGSVLRQQLDDTVFADCDALVTVCALTTALPVAAFGKSAVWTPMRTIGFNLTGHPALALPIGLSDGLPMGMQIIGRHRDESTICQIGDAFERHAGHADIKPPRIAG